MRPRQRLVDWLRGRRGDPAGRLRALSAGASPAPGPVPVKPSRLVVSGRSPLMDVYRPFHLRPLDPRIRLWRDTAAVLVVFALAFVVSDWLPRPQQAVLAETFAPTQTLGEPQTTEPGVGEAPSASATESVASPSPAPSASAATATPVATRRPTPRVTPRPSIAPIPTSTPPESPSPSPSAESPSPSPSAESPSPSPSDSAAPSDSLIPSESPAPTATPAPTDPSPGP